MQPDDVYALSHDAVERLAEHNPLEATEYGVPGYEHAWPDLSPAGTADRADMLRGFQRRFTAVEESDDRWEALARRVALDYFDDEIDKVDHHEQWFDVNNIACSFVVMRSAFDVMDKKSPEGWSDIAARLETIDEPAAGWMARLEEGRAQGVTASRRQVLAVMEQAESYAAADSSLRELTAEAAAVVDGELADRVAAGVEHACEVFGRMGGFLGGDYLAAAIERDGVGEERYLRSVRYHLGTSLDLAETYAWAWSEIARIRAEMKAVAAEIAPGASAAEVIEILQNDPGRRSGDRDEFIEVMQGRQHIALTELRGTHFEVPDNIAAVDTLIAPAGGALGAYYVGPNEDFTRRGSIWFSLGDQHEVPYYDQVSTAYHEGFPGHHLQVGTQVGLSERMSRLQRLWEWRPGTGEGWALYAERVMHELGYLEKPDYVFGYLANDMLRACRVVVDIGLHVGLPIPADQPFCSGETWSFERAVELLVEYATQSEPVARSEVTRYLGWPAQAIAYKVGERTILDMRAELVRRRGDSFNLKAFHSQLLEIGPVGLDLAREVVLGG